MMKAMAKKATKYAKKVIGGLAAVSSLATVYLLGFVFVAGVFHAEEWSFVIPLLPAFAAGAAVMWHFEE